jgi:hypothetical protein
VRTLNEQEKEDNDEAIMSTTSNASSAYDLNQNMNQSALCNCNSTITHHYVSNLCENCNNLIISNGNIYSTASTCYASQFNYCADVLNNNLNDNQHDCCSDSQTTTPTENQPQNDLNNNENLDNIQTTENDENGNGNETNSINLNCNGLIRLDMSQIMDNTGLPTYDAAIKLESSGYV